LQLKTKQGKRERDESDVEFLETFQFFLVPLPLFLFFFSFLHCIFPEEHEIQQTTTTTTTVSKQGKQMAQAVFIAT